MPVADWSMTRAALARWTVLTWYVSMLASTVSFQFPSTSMDRRSTRWTGPTPAPPPSWSSRSRPTAPSAVDQRPRVGVEVDEHERAPALAAHRPQREAAAVDVAEVLWRWAARRACRRGRRSRSGSRTRAGGRCCPSARTRPGRPRCWQVLKKARTSSSWPRTRMIGSRELLEREEVAGSGHLGVVGHQQPAPAEHLPAFELGEALVDVAPRGHLRQQREARRVLGAVALTAAAVEDLRLQGGVHHTCSLVWISSRRRPRNCSESM